MENISKTISSEYVNYLKSTNRRKSDITLLRIFPHIYNEYMTFGGDENKFISNCNLSFLIFILLALCGEIIYTAVEVENWIILIGEVCSLAIMLGFIFMYCIYKKLLSWKYLPLAEGWLVYLIYMLNIILVVIQYSKGKESIDRSLIGKFYFYLTIGNVGMTFFIRVINSFHYWNMIIVIFFNLLILIFVCIKTESFSQESFLILVLSCFIVCNGYKVEFLNKSFYDEYIKEKVNTFLVNGIMDGMKIGSCTIKSNFLITQTNDYFASNLSHLKNQAPMNQGHTFTLKENTMKGKPALENSQLLKTSIFNLLDIVHNQKEVLFVNKEEGEGTYLEVDEMYKRVDFDHTKNNGNENNKITLKEAILQHIDNLQTNGIFSQMPFSFHIIGQFKIYFQSIQHFYDVYLRKRITPLDNEDTYELLFNEITDCFKREKMKIEAKYKNLLLSKISHEFKAPIMLIQNTIDGILSDNSMNNTTFLKLSDISPRVINHPDKKRRKSLTSGLPIPVSENLLKIKYLNEIILLLVLDLTEYITLKSRCHEIDKSCEKGSQCLLDLNTLKEYLINLGKVYCLIFDKDIQVHVILDECLENSKIVIDDKKLKQIIANLLSNAIKSTVFPNEISITITVNPGMNSNIDDWNKLSLIKNSNQDMIFQLNDAKLPNNPQCLTSDNLAVSIDNSPVQKKKLVRYHSCRSSNSKTFKKVSGFNSRRDLEVMIILEDSGYGINESMMKAINNKKNISVSKVDQTPSRVNIRDYILQHDAEEYSNKKGLGTGLKICKKLCNDLGIDMKCERVVEKEKSILDNINCRTNFQKRVVTFSDKNRKFLGTRFTLFLHNELDYSRKIVSLDNTQICNDRIIRLNSIDKHNLCYESETKSSISLSDSKININDDGDGEISLDGLNVKARSNHPSYSNKYTSMKHKFKISSGEVEVYIPGTRSPMRKILTLGETAKFGINEAQLFSLNGTKTFSQGPGPNDNSFRKNVNTVCFSKRDSSQNRIKDKEFEDATDQQLESERYVFNLAKVQPANLEGNATNIEQHGKDHCEIGIDYKYTFNEIPDPETICKRSFIMEDSKIRAGSYRYKKDRLFPVSSRNLSLDYCNFIPASASNRELVSKKPIVESPDKILIIDDNSSNSRAIEKLVKNYYKKKQINTQLVTKTLSDGIELLYEIYQELKNGTERTKVIFSDQMMEYMHGSESFTILKNIFHDKKLPPIPFVICSSFNDEGHKEKMKILGIEHVYQKPINSGNVEYVFNALLKRK